MKNKSEMPTLRNRRKPEQQRYYKASQLRETPESLWASDRRLYTTQPNFWCFFVCVGWIASVIAISVGLTILTCNNIKRNECPQYPLMYQPITDHKKLVPSMKQNNIIFNRIHSELNNDMFQYTSYWKHIKYNIDINDYDKYKYIESNKDNKIDSIDISAVVYSNIFNMRIGEVGIPLGVLYHEFCINEIIVVDDNMLNSDSEMLWEKEILFGEYMPDSRVHPSMFSNDNIEEKFEKWKEIDGNRIHERKNIIRTNNVGKFKGFDIGSKVAFKPYKTRNNLDLILLLDTNHQLPLNDIWIMDALSIFDADPELKILGCFSGLIKNGETFGNINLNDKRNPMMDNSKEFFYAASKEFNKDIIQSSYDPQYNKQKYNHDRLNIVNMFKQIKQFYDDNFDNILSQNYDLHQIIRDSKAKYQNSNNNNKNIYNDMDDETKDILKNDPDLLKGNPYAEIIKREFMNNFDEVLRKNFPDQPDISMKSMIKEIGDKYKKCDELFEHNEQELTDECQAYLENKGTHFYEIPYEIKVRTVNDEMINKYKHSKDNINNNDKELYLIDKWINFMYITAVKLPIFIRKDWYFTKLLPHLLEIESQFETGINQDWLDIEISLHTWNLGGKVGLYDTNGFKFDRKLFSDEIKRNRKISSEFISFQENHILSQNNYDIWNLTEIYNLNENSKNKNIRVRPNNEYINKNGNKINPTSQDNSRKIIKMYYDTEQHLSKLIKNSIKKV